MKSEITVDLRTNYTACMFKRNNKEQTQIRLKIVRYAQQHGIKPAARHFETSKSTVKKWLRTFNKSGTGGLSNESREPLTCPHKTPLEVEKAVVKKRLETPCYAQKL